MFHFLKSLIMFCFIKKFLGYTFELSFSVKKQNKNEIFSAYLEKKISEMEKKASLYKGKTYARNSVCNYKKIANIWPDFESSLGAKGLKFSDITIDIYSRFMEFCDERNYMESTKYQYASLVKAVMNYALEDGVSENTVQNSKGFVTHRSAAVFKKVYLTRDEIARLAALKTEPGTLPDKVKDVFLVGCYTGQRFSDYSSLSIDEMENIMVDGTAHKALRKIQRKTGHTVVIPVLDDNLLTIMNKWNGHLPKITISALNATIKVLCREAGINSKVTTFSSRGGKKLRSVQPKYELVSSHTARRSYITNLYMEGTLSTEQIRSISGHMSEESFRRYLCQNQEEEAAEIIKKYISRK